MLVLSTARREGPLGRAVVLGLKSAQLKEVCQSGLGLELPAQNSRRAAHLSCGLEVALRLNLPETVLCQHL